MNFPQLKTVRKHMDLAKKCEIIALHVKRYPKCTLSQVKRALDLKVAHNTIRKVLKNKGASNNGSEICTISKPKWIIYHTSVESTIRAT